MVSIYSVCFKKQFINDHARSPERNNSFPGASGQVGGALVKLLAPLGKVKAPSSRDLNLKSSDSIRSLVRSVRPRWVISAGAYTAVD